MVLLLAGCHERRAPLDDNPAHAVSYNEDLIEKPWTARRSVNSRNNMAGSAVFISDTTIRFLNNGIQIKSYEVEDPFGSRGFRVREEITRYRLQGDTLVFYYGKPVAGVIRELSDSALVIDFPGHTAHLHSSGQEG